MDESLIAELVAFAAAGRPERLEGVLLSDAPDAVRAELSAVGEGLAALALTLPREAPPAGLRARIMASVAARREAPPARRVVVVLDMINDHLTPGRPLEVPRARDIVPALLSRLEAARRDHVPVVYVLDQHEPDDSDLDAWATHAVVGTPGAEVWPALAPREGEIVVRKPTYSAFVGSNLEAVLEGLQVDTIELTGCLTEIGMAATATDALQRGFAVEIPALTQAGASEVTEKVTLGILGLMPPYGPARSRRLASYGGGAAAEL